jgi:hypothetical protein
VEEEKKHKRSTELDGGGEYLVFSISLSLHREGRQEKMAVFLKIFHAAESELTVPLTCVQRTLLKTLA